ncbi:hypothetical protein CANTEDRAFT_92197 [Yamadazyma tenuis ATCC 10573]|uniref:Uncharacterized protein n=1 Tax=Candida tenuis (strain ATCC 10573 / BCRC 21748 / CBS 615 / JCM 9827 / NBRC 10315 / NRRL Y-1498 / VKM Y-70) TaxID=590646 RepID=G3AYI3_CANTC|nr:uncharacterized protein CANTEDRAFT_92197 [Yamadazyma tenuis ATCC 10573]EGV65858.1 hypothetical protein CANTEDRAFT_92197 [Yamadazyma tenuis ATCC 10573]
MPMNQVYWKPPTPKSSRHKSFTPSPKESVTSRFERAIKADGKHYIIRPLTASRSLSASANLGDLGIDEGIDKSASSKPERQPQINQEDVSDMVIDIGLQVRDLVAETALQFVSVKDKLDHLSENINLLRQLHHEQTESESYHLRDSDKKMSMRHQNTRHLGRDGSKYHVSIDGESSGPSGTYIPMITSFIASTCFITPLVVFLIDISSHQ